MQKKYFEQLNEVKDLKKEFSDFKNQVDLFKNVVHSFKEELNEITALYEERMNTLSEK